jgi:type III secretion protein Q
MALPFDLPRLSRGYAELTPAARATGVDLADRVGRALSDLLGSALTVRGRAVPGVASPGAAVARVALDLAALPGVATLEVDPAVVVRLVDRLAGGEGAPVAATALTPVETAALEALVLAALDAACGVPAVEALAPRLSRGGPDPASPLAIELDVVAGAIAGRARVLVPAAAVRALAGEGPDLAACAVPVPASIRRGTATLAAEELDALAPGDVLVVDEPPDGLDVLALPGGLRARGRLDDDAFHVEEMTMAERHAQLPVTLEVELARVEIPIAELARLEPGAALPLGLDRRGLVTLRVGERAVARGELVDVDGAVGVRILAVEVAP